MPQLHDALVRGVADSAQVRTDLLYRHALAHDASHFLLLPQAVVTPANAAEVAALIQTTKAAGVGLAFRSGGTSLSGQGSSDQVLADVRSRFTDIVVLDGGTRVKVQPGVTVRRVNAHLAPYGYKLGPDPASEVACTIGGVVANNSSGMACGITENSYRTIESLVIVLGSGTIIDTGQPDADEQLRIKEPVIYEGLTKLRDRVNASPPAVAKITQQFSMKNTMGYGLNSFVDFKRPSDILTHLMIGSEGTLGFIAEATFRTVPLKPYANSALLVFRDLFDANRSLPALVEAQAAALELMDETSLRVGQRFPNCPEAIAALEIAHQAAILLEFQASEPGQLAEITQAAAQTLAELPLTSPAELISDVTARNSLWSFRKGLYTSVAAGRPQGTTALLEDVVVPVDKLANTCVDLGAAFDQYGYHDAVIFGHAKDGNIHFMITDHFTDSAAKAKLGDFTSDMVEIICGYQGSCKAEHGTGRVMAPFVRRQWGDELYQVMLDVKHLFDPELRLNPGVLIAENPQAHLNQIKAPEAVDDLVDLCVECGYCEPTCPSRELTLTPRQRIAIQRDIAAAAASGDQATVRELERAYVYDGIHTCAVDGWCGLACPVSINTGHYVKKLRSAAVPKPVAAGWTFAANHWKGTTGLAAFALSTVKALPGSLQTAVIGVDHAARAVIGPDTVPLWSRELPQGGKRRARPAPSIPVAAVYLPACVNAMFGSANSSLDGRDGPKPPGVQSAFEWLCALVGIALFVPPDVDMLCCGTVWTSKGILRGKAVMAKKVIKALERATQDWKLPVVCDASSCTEGFQRTVAEAGIEAKIVDAVQFVAERILPLLPEHTKLPSITLHETCSSTQLGSNEALRQVAGAVAEVVQVPIDKGCCAFAGDRGLLHPELTAAATRAEAAEVARLNATVHASCNRTCELGMTRATGKPYRHVLELLAEQLAASTDSAAASANPDK